MLKAIRGDDFLDLDDIKIFVNSCPRVGKNVKTSIQFAGKNMKRSIETSSEKCKFVPKLHIQKDDQHRWWI